MNGGAQSIRRFQRRHVYNHLLMLVTFMGLVLTGMPQKFPEQAWAKGIVLIIGGVERTRALHHILGTIMALQLVWHVIESVWAHLVRRYPMPMIPVLKDVRDFMQQVRYNLGVADEPPRMDRYTFAEKLEYLALVWGTALMVATGVVLLYPVRWSVYLTGQGILAAKAAHGGEAILAFLSILTWHAYFVHVRHWNKSMFNGHLDEEAYAEEHPLELERMREGVTVGARPTAGRVLVAVVLTVLLVAATAALWHWLAHASTVLPTTAG